MELAENIIIFASAIIAVEWVFAYHWKSRGDWRVTNMGRHLMVFMASLAAILSMIAVETLIEDVLSGGMPGWWEWLELVVITSLPFVLAWRRVVLYQAQRTRKNHRAVHKKEE